MTQLRMQPALSLSELNPYQSRRQLTMLSRGIIPTLSLFFAAAHASSFTDAEKSWSIPSSFTNNLRVPVTLGVMSRCPDALLCETLFDKVIPKVAEKIDLSLAFIARCGHTPSSDRLCTDSFATDSIHLIQNSASPAAMDAMNVPGMCSSYAPQSTRH